MGHKKLNASYRGRKYLKQRGTLSGQNGVSSGHLGTCLGLSSHRCGHLWPRIPRMVLQEITGRFVHGREGCNKTDSWPEADVITPPLWSLPWMYNNVAHRFLFLYPNVLSVPVRGSSGSGGPGPLLPCLSKAQILTFVCQLPPTNISLFEIPLLKGRFSEL